MIEPGMTTVGECEVDDSEVMNRLLSTDGHLMTDGQVIINGNPVTIKIEHLGMFFVALCPATYSLSLNSGLT